MSEDRPNIPDELKPARPSWHKRILMTALRSPLSTTIILLFLYCGIQAFLLNINPTGNKLYMICLIFIWIFWYVARNLFQLILLAIIIAYGVSLYHDYSTREISQCEASGGEWNEQTEQCEEKTGFWAQVFKRFHDLAIYAEDGKKKAPE